MDSEQTSIKDRVDLAFKVAVGLAVITVRYAIVGYMAKQTLDVVQGMSSTERR